MKSVWLVVKHEWLRQRVNPATYLLVAISGGLWLFMFFQQFFLIGEASLRPLFAFFPWLALLLLPALAMGTFAKERSDHTLELLLTHPIKENTLILGKWLSILTIPIVLSLSTVPLAMLVSTAGLFDWGAYFAQLIAVWLLSGMLAAFAMLFSAYLKDQVAALLTSIFSGFIWILIGFELVTARLPLQVSSFISNLSFLTHTESILRGVVDVRDVWFFLSLTTLFLSVTLLVLQKARFGKAKRGFILLQQAVILLSIVVLLTNIVGQRIPGRIDLTQSKLYSLSPSTKTVLSNLPDVVTLTLYASNSVPAQLQPTLRSVKDLLGDYQVAGGSMLQLVQKDPSSSQELKQEAASFGVQEVQFNVISQEEFNVKSGYLGLVITYADQSEVLPFISTTNDLEYQITSLLYQLTRQSTAQIGLLGGHGEKSGFGELSSWTTQLERQFEIVDLDGTVTDGVLQTPFDENLSAIIIVGPASQYEPALLSALTEYVAGGGSLFVLASGVLADPQTQSVVPIDHNLNTLLSEYSLSISTDFVYDLRSNETIRVSQGPVQFLSAYPLWIRAKSTENSILTLPSQTLFITWGSSVVAKSELIEQRGWTLTPAVVTTQYGGTIDSPSSIAPDQTFSQDDLTTQVIGVFMDPPEASSSGRLAVIGSGDLLINELVEASPGNAAFATATLAWLVGDSTLDTLQSKAAIDHSLILSSTIQPMVFSSIAYGTSSIAPLLLGLSVFWFRKKKQGKPFAKSGVIEL